MLDKILEENKGNFPLEEMPKNHEKRFEEKLQFSNIQPKKKFNYSKFLGVAAAFVFLISLFWVWNSIQPKPTEKFAYNEEYKPENLTQTEIELTQKINLSKEDLLAHGNQNQTMVNETLVALKNLEIEYEKLEKDLMMSGNDRVIEAMKQNLNLRMKILQKTQTKINPKK